MSRQPEWVFPAYKTALISSIVSPKAASGSREYTMRPIPEPTANRGRLLWTEEELACLTVAVEVKARSVSGRASLGLGEVRWHIHAHVFLKTVVTRSTREDLGPCKGKSNLCLISKAHLSQCYENLTQTRKTAVCGKNRLPMPTKLQHSASLILMPISVQ